MKKWYYIFVFILFSDCSNSAENNNKKIVTNPKAEIKEKKTNIEQKNNILKNFPKNCVIEEWYPSAFKGSYVFYENGNYIFIYGGIGKSEKYDIGKWKLNKNIISIHINKEIGLRPIGKPINPEVSHASNPEEYYEYNSYEKFEKLVNKRQKIDINNFLAKDICYINNEKKATDFNIKIEDYLLQGQFKIASCKLLTEKDLKNLTKKQLKIMRNEIFARYGYIFKTNELKNYFQSIKWYRPLKKNVDVYLSNIEKKNLSLIKEFENR